MFKFAISLSVQSRRVNDLVRGFISVIYFLYYHDDISKCLSMMKHVIVCMYVCKCACMFHLKVLFNFMSKVVHRI